MDKDIEELLPTIRELIRGGAMVWLKWTCPKCGDRVTANKENTYYTGGYTHEDCGETYYGTMFGMLVLSSFDKNLAEGAANG